jgi:hypothetical protein
MKKRNQRLFLGIAGFVLWSSAGCSSTSNADCGNGTIEEWELCDPKIKSGEGSCPKSCDDGNVCTKDTLVGSASRCTASCEHEQITACKSVDGGITCSRQNATLNRGDICKADSDCKCPYACIKSRTNTPPDPNKVWETGSCWSSCDPKSPTSTCASGEICWGDRELSWGCLPTGTLSGTFSNIPIYTYPNRPLPGDPLGTANIILNVNPLGMLQFKSGYGVYFKSDTEGKYFVLMSLFPGTTIDLFKYLSILFEVNGQYAPGGTVSIEALDPNNGCGIYYEDNVRDTQNKIVRKVLRTAGHLGSISLTAAGKGNKEPTSGIITQGSTVVGHAFEVCGSMSSPCQ